MRQEREFIKYVMSNYPNFTKETSVCEKCIDENNNLPPYSKGGTGGMGGAEQYCPWYRVWNLNGKFVLGPNDGKNICPFKSN